eukprot:jgi/Hompol1/533/HPOL_002532-RA
MLAPPANKGLQELNRSLFDHSHSLLALKIPAAASGEAMTKLRGLIAYACLVQAAVHDAATLPVPAHCLTNTVTRSLNREPQTIDCMLRLLAAPRLKSIVDDPQETGVPKKRKLVLLSPDIDAPICRSQMPKDIDSLPDPVKAFALQHGAELTEHTIVLPYDYWSTEQILRSILPDSMEVPGAFETVGHIAHLNLRDQYQPYKSIIGQVILDKSRHIKTVVNKTDNIDHTFRFFQMELLAGENNMMADLKECGCHYRFDFSKVYWNSRLQGEHERIVRFFKKGDLICDVFGGVGPFALPAAKNAQCIVFANDLNPQSYKYLIENIKLNKLERRIRPSNLDGRQFIRQSLQDLNDPDVWETLQAAERKLAKKRRESKDAKPSSSASTSIPEPEVYKPMDVQHVIDGTRYFKHYIMNLPATAIEFLDAFQGLYSGKRDTITDEQLPMIHCHCFSRAEDLKADVVERVERVIGVRLDQNHLSVHIVRTVAPNKIMLCISFRLPPALAFAEPGVLGKRKSVSEDGSVSPIALRDKRASGSDQGQNVE